MWFVYLILILLGVADLFIGLVAIGVILKAFNYFNSVTEMRLDSLTRSMDHFAYTLTTIDENLDMLVVTEADKQQVQQFMDDRKVETAGFL